MSAVEAAAVVVTLESVRKALVNNDFMVQGWNGFKGLHDTVSSSDESDEVVVAVLSRNNKNENE